MQIASWILYSIAIILFILIQQNFLDGKTLLSVTLRDNSITFGFPTLIFLMGAFFHSWSVYIEKNVKENLYENTLVPTLGFFLGMSFLAFIVVILITFIEGL